MATAASKIVPFEQPPRGSKQATANIFPGDFAPETAAFWSEIVRTLARRRRALEFNQIEMDEHLGLATGLCGKWECGDRRPSAWLFALWAGALNVRLVAVVDDGTDGLSQRDAALVRAAEAEAAAAAKMDEARALLARARKRDTESRRRAAEVDRRDREIETTRREVIAALQDTRPRPAALSIEVTRCPT